MDLCPRPASPAPILTATSPKMRRRSTIPGHLRRPYQPLGSVLIAHTSMERQTDRMMLRLTWIQSLWIHIAFTKQITTSASTIPTKTPLRSPTKDTFSLLVELPAPTGNWMSEAVIQPVDAIQGRDWTMIFQIWRVEGVVETVAQSIGLVRCLQALPRPYSGLARW